MFDGIKQYLEARAILKAGLLVTHSLSLQVIWVMQVGILVMHVINIMPLMKVI